MIDQQIYIGFGIRRTKDTSVLDVTYNQIRSIQTDTIQSMLKEVNITPNEFNVLTSHQKTQCLDYLESTQDKEICSINVENTSYATYEVGVMVLTSLQDPVKSAEEAYFKLHCLSQRLVLPHTLNLDGLFGTLTNNAWTNHGPILPEDVPAERLKLMSSGQTLVVTHVDKFPYMVNYVIPSGVRIASGSQVRLGAYLGDGTTVMPSGYINFNAGTKGHAMVEGRVSAGVVVGDKSDVGGGASIMGTLSGGNKDVISIGEQCLLGANAGTGISLGNGCTIAAGLYVYAGMKVSVYNDLNQPIDAQGNPVNEGENIMKAKDLSGRDNLLFIMDSQTGVVTCSPNKKMIELNASLHKND